jgi:hypothetical protein
MNPVYCKQCGATLRALAGIHRAGEPRMATDDTGSYIRCPACGHVNRDLTPARLAEEPERQDGD